MLKYFISMPLQLEVGHTVSLHLRWRQIGSGALLYDVIDLSSEVQARLGWRRRQVGGPPGGPVSGPASAGLHLAPEGNSTVGDNRAHGSARHEYVVQQAELALAVIRQSSVGVLLVSARLMCVALAGCMAAYMKWSGVCRLPGNSTWHMLSCLCCWTGLSVFNHLSGGFTPGGGAGRAAVRGRARYGGRRSCGSGKDGQQKPA